LLSWALLQETKAFSANRIPGLRFAYILFFFGFRRLSILFRKFFRVTLAFFLVLIAYLVLKISAVGGHEIFIAFSSFGAMALLMTVLYPLIESVLKFYFERSGAKKTPLAPWMFLGVFLLWFF
jgi:hypothetical protein